MNFIDQEKLEYLQWMLDNFPNKSDVKLVDGKHDRWLGFVQGALWYAEVESIDTFREDVREGKGFDKLKEYLKVLN